MSVSKHKSIFSKSILVTVKLNTHLIFLIFLAFYNSDSSHLEGKKNQEQMFQILNL